jgi:hypothetical protein
LKTPDGQWTLDMPTVEPDDGGNRTELIFCQDMVEPDFVTQTLELLPTESFKVGEVIPVGDIQRQATVGMWKLRLPYCQSVETVEEQLGRWVRLLGTKAERIAHLLQLGYRPYLDCRAERRSLSLCVDPEILAGLGALGIALSVWLYEAPGAGTLGGDT